MLGQLGATGDLGQRILRGKGESSASEFLRPSLFQRRQKHIKAGGDASDPEPTSGIPLVGIFEFHFDPGEPDPNSP